MKIYSIHHYEKGITLLESMIAMLVLSIGLLGTAHLMATGIKHSNSSYARTQATYYAESIAERMRANPGAFGTTFDYNSIDSDNINCGVAPTPYCATNSSSEGAVCNAAEMAIYDAYYVSCGTDGGNNGNGLKVEIPSGRMLVQCQDAPCTSSSAYQITVSWVETEATDGSDVDDPSVEYIIQP